MKKPPVLCHKCDCGNIATRKTSDGWTCEPCAKAYALYSDEIERMVYEQRTDLLTERQLEYRHYRVGRGLVKRAFGKIKNKYAENAAVVASFGATSFSLRNTAKALNQSFGI